MAGDADRAAALVTAHIRCWGGSIAGPAPRLLTVAGVNTRGG